MSDGGLTAEDVRSATFEKPPFGKRGYNEDEVNALLDDIVTTIENLENQT
jgi:DivIVA domain-containing protein